MGLSVAGFEVILVERVRQGVLLGVDTVREGTRSTQSDADGISPDATIPLSVVLPNFNDGEVLRRALRSLLTQKPLAKEIIVVDDGSSDDSVSIVESLLPRYPSIRLIRNQKNVGIIASVRRALEVATGEFLLFASSDDFADMPTRESCPRPEFLQ